MYYLVEHTENIVAHVCTAGLVFRMVLHLYRRVCKKYRTILTMHGVLSIYSAFVQFFRKLFIMIEMKLLTLNSVPQMNHNAKIHTHSANRNALIHA